LLKLIQEQRQKHLYLCLLQFHPNVELVKILKGRVEPCPTKTPQDNFHPKVESKINGISIDFSEIKGTLQNHEVRLQALNWE